MEMLLEQRLKEAFDKKKQNDINNYTWKYEKVWNGDQYVQRSAKLVDLPVKELKDLHDYCDLMLNNGSKKNPGRYVFIDIINEQINRCNTELFLRWLWKENQINKFSFMNIILTFLKNNPDLDRDKLVLNDVVGQCPLEYRDLPIDLVLDGCMDTLGLFDRDIFTKSFILRQGIWPSEEEKKYCRDNKIKLTQKYILDYLGLNQNYKIRFTGKGLSLEQMKAMINLKLRAKKFCDISTSQLELLRNRILYALKNEVQYHISQWERRKREISEVLKLKGVDY